VVLAQPPQDAIAQTGCQAAKFLDFLVAGDSGPLVDPPAALGPKYLQRVNDRPIVADRQLERLDGMMVNPAPLTTSYPAALSAVAAHCKAAL
jgi:hypothetical protein